MRRLLLLPSPRVLATLAMLAALVTLALAPLHSAAAIGFADTTPGGPPCCGGGHERA